MSQHQSECTNEPNDNFNLSDSQNEHEMNVDQSQGQESPDQKILNSLQWYINWKNTEKNSIIVDHNDLANRFERERCENRSLKGTVAAKDRKIVDLTKENTELKAKITDREEEMRKQFMAEMKKQCIRCESKSKWQYHSLPFCSNKCYSDMAAIFQK